ncbi:MAG: transglycosylase family protein, partial [Nakamurella sp.]
MRRATTLLAAVALTAGTLIFGAASSAFADPSANDWQQLRLCESSNDYTMNNGNGYFGAYQFDQATWTSVGGTGRPDQASKAEQDFRALYLYRMRGWAPWICAALVGLSNDSDGGSGVKPVAGAGGGGGGGGSTPAPPVSKPPASNNHGFPGTLKFGDYSAALKNWQRQAGAMGYGSLEGTGWFGDKTKAAVAAIQAKAGISSPGAINAA